MAKSRKY